MGADITTLLAVEAFILEHARNLRNMKVLLDVDVASIFNVSQEELYNAVKKNRKRFPPDFMFQLIAEEKKELLLSGKKIFAFSQMGIMMLGGQLKSSRAIKTHMQLIELFVGSMPNKVFDILSGLQNQNKEK
jgi:phage regulator Rha-like protein